MKTSMDMERFCQTFFEECGEHLAEMERILLSLNVEEPDAEDLNALFRSAHTIKGSAGIFGFSDMCSVTHVLESLLDRLRNHALEFSQSMVDLFLKAKDAIAMQLAGHQCGELVDAQFVEEVCSSLKQLIAMDDSPIAAVPGAEEIVSSANEDRDANTFQVVFTPDSDLFLRGARMDFLLDELAQLGTVVPRATVEGAPHMEALHPEQCHTRWHLELTGTCNEAEIRDVFEFVAEEHQLAISLVPSETDTDDQGIDRPENAPSDASQAEPSQMFGRRAYDRDETVPGAFGRRGVEAESSIRVGVAKVDQLINQVGELVITQAMLRQIGDHLDPALFENLHRSLLQLERNTRDLQQSVMSIRLVPIGIVFSRFPRMVRDLASKLGKQVELKLSGEATELDKGLVEKIADPLTHLVRNALDHALETPELRTQAGKSPTGTITLQASQIGGRIVIDVIDDGAGLNREKILAKAKERGIAASDAISDDEVWQLIFAPGFSTAETVTDVSGRGVGMDVVLKNVQSLGGRVLIASEAGQGTRVSISLPLTLAIVDGLSVGVGEEKFIIPLNAIVESLQPKPEEVMTVNGRKVVQVRGQYLPLLSLYRLFNLETGVRDPEQGILVLVEVEGEQAAILVDALLDEHQVVVKSLETNFRKVDGTSGATILGDGRVALILDIHQLLQMRNNNTQHYEEVIR